MITLFEVNYSFNILDNYIKRNIKTDIDLLKFMDSIDYGYFANGKSYKGNDLEDDFDSYHLMNPLEVFKYRIGVCQDQALFEYYVLNKLGYQNIKLFFIPEKSKTKDISDYIEKYRLEKTKKLLMNI